jgi:TM2 domain-containing membrane protein YozV
LLWPRKIYYETTSILIIYSIVRYAASFFVISIAADRQIHTILIFGGTLSVLMSIKTHLILSKIQLAHKKWERHYDSFLYTLSSLIFPLLAYFLATHSGLTIRYETARLIQFICWWGLAGLLFILCIDLPDLGADQPLKSRRPAALWRALSIIAMPILLGNALWVGGDTPTLIAVLPVALAAYSVYCYLRRAFNCARKSFHVLVPAIVTGLILVLPEPLLMGAKPVLPHWLVFVAFAPIAALSILVIAPLKKREALTALGLVLGFSPIILLPTPHIKELYMLSLSLLILAHGLWKRFDKSVVTSAIISSFFVFHIRAPMSALDTVYTMFVIASIVSMIVAWRRPGSKSFALGQIFTGACFATALFVPAISWPLIILSFLTSSSLAFLNWRHDYKLLSKLSLALPLMLISRQIGPNTENINPGIILIILAFAAIPLGVLIAFRREGQKEQLTQEADEEP